MAGGRLLGRLGACMGAKRPPSYFTEGWQVAPRLSLVYLDGFARQCGSGQRAPKYFGA